MATKKNKEEIDNQELTEAAEVEVAEVATEDVIEEAAEETTEDAPKGAKKAGPKSAKAVREAEAEATRKEKAADKAAAPKPRLQKPNPLKQHGKKYREAVKLVDQDKSYELAEAIELAKKTSSVKFDASVEVHVNLGVDPRQADQMVRSSVVLPAGTGKTLRVAVVAPSDLHKEAKEAGADLVGEDDLIATIDKGQIDFDVLIATPQVMSKLGKLAKVLGPKGLMPNPKSGTVTAKVGEAVKASKGGRVEFRIDKQAIVHQAIGKVSFANGDLEKNALAFVQAVMNAKPSAAKGTYVKRMSMTTSMGPGIRLDHTSVIAAANASK